MSYSDSIRQVNIAEALYYLADERGDLIDAPLAALFKAKAAHRALFGTLTRVNGEWV